LAELLFYAVISKPLPGKVRGSSIAASRGVSSKWLLLVLMRAREKVFLR
jgi:hypothetical protein